MSNDKVSSARENSTKSTQPIGFTVVDTKVVNRTEVFLSQSMGTIHIVQAVSLCSRHQSPLFFH
jgi:hypothetical protein